MFGLNKSDKDIGMAATKDVRLDIRILELAISKICHDVVSPVSAIVNGLEILEDMGPEGAEDALELLTHSATQASVKLQLFRLIYGRAGREDGRPAYEFRDIVSKYLDDGRVQLDWPEDLLVGAEESLPEGTLKTLSNLVLLAAESLHGTGSVVLKREGQKITVVATGANARLHEGTEAALKGETDPDALESRLVHAYLSGRFAAAFGLDLTYEDMSGGRVVLTLCAQSDS